MTPSSLDSFGAEESADRWKTDHLLDWRSQKNLELNVPTCNAEQLHSTHCFLVTILTQDLKAEDIICPAATDKNNNDSTNNNYIYNRQQQTLIRSVGSRCEDE